ncbi:MAG: thioredoxin domain-containing protein, partial [Rhodobacterales bacterium]
FAWHPGTNQPAAPQASMPPRNQVPEPEANFGEIPLRESDAVLGDPNAPVTLIKYGSLTCPHCAAFHVAAAAEMKRDHIPNGRVRYVHRHFPLNQPAMAAAMLLHSGNGSSERFYALLDILYTEQSSWAGEQDYVSALRQIAARTGVNGDAFNAILSDRALAERIVAERDEGTESYGVSATPTLLINGGRYGGNRDIAQLDMIFDRVG